MPLAEFVNDKKFKGAFSFYKKVKGKLVEKILKIKI